MSRPSSGVPTYRLHKQSGQAVVTLSDPSGRRRDVLLGIHGSQESKAEYARVLHEWTVMNRKIDTWCGVPADLTIAELIERFWEWAEGYYRYPDGTTTHELEEFKRALCPLKYLHGGLVVAEYGPLRLRAVRELMIAGYDHPNFGKQQPLSRGVINKRVSRVKHVFKWGVENELILPAIYQGLASLAGLRRGRSKAYETKPVKAVPLAFVEATISKASPTIGDMIRLQLLTGVRPGELLIMRAIDIDMTGPIWVFTPHTHKNAHRDQARVITIGPRGQEIVRRYLQTDVMAYLFSPAVVMRDRHTALRARRKSKVQPSQVCRKKAAPKKKPGHVYLRTSYARAIKRYAAEAGVPHWHPHQLRHTAATEIRKEFGIDAARAVLGHRNSKMTEVYAELDQGQAMKVMAKIG